MQSMDIGVPQSLKRFVVLGESCGGLHVEVAAALHASPFFQRQQIVLWSHTTLSENVVGELEFIRRAAAEIDDARQQQQQRGSSPASEHTPSLLSVLRVANSAQVSSPVRLSDFAPNTSTDLYVYVASARSVFHVESLSRLLPIAGPPGTCVIVASNDVCSGILSCISRHKALQRWKIILIRATHLGPSALGPSEYPRFHDELHGPLENICLGIALGVIKQLPVNAGQVAGIVPMDVALNVALLVVCMVAKHQLPSTIGERSVIDIGVGDPPGTGLVWGMVGEYLIDYYGRYHRQINEVAPLSMFEQDPSVDFQMHFPDLWNWGMTFTAPIIWYRSFVSRFHKSHLQRFPHSTTMERLQRILGGIDQTLEGLQSPTGQLAAWAARGGASGGTAVVGAGAATASNNNSSIQAMMQRNLTASRKKNTNHGCNPEEQAPSFSGGGNAVSVTTYQMLLRLLSRGGPSAVKWLPAVSLNWIQWEMYVKRVCVSVLQFTVRHVLDHRQPVAFPAPTRAFHNDLVFNGQDRAPPTNLWLRRMFPDLHWALRCGQQPNGLNIQLHAGGTEQRRLSILAQPHIQLLINQLAREQNVAKAALEQRADAILRGIGDTMNHQQLRTLGLMIRKIFMTLYDRINLNPEAYDTLFAAFRRPRCSVVIIPAHRSYIDFLVISYLLVMLGLPVPHICSGEDFLRLGGLAEMLRGSGAFFMRRSFKSDRLYGALFKEYIRHLVRGGECVEFFVEGMRSRTGKTIPPKLGILKFVTDAFFEKQDEIDDVLFVPVGLSYEKILEGNVYADELMGIPKPKETIANLLKSATVLRSSYGALNIVVGEPVSLKSFADDPHQCPAGFERVPEADRAVIRSSSSSVSAGGGTYTPVRTLANLAWRITYELQRSIVVTPTALVAAVVQCMIDVTRFRGSGVPAALIASNVEWLRSAVLHRHGKMSTQFAVCDGMQLMTYAMQHLNPRIWVSPLSHVFLNFEMQQTTQMLLSIYSNQLIHVFADEALLIIAAFAFGQQRGGVSDGSNGANPTMSAAGRAAGVTMSQQQQLREAVAVGAGDDSALTPTAASNLDRHISMGDLKSVAKVLRRLLACEIPNYQRPCPISMDSWLAASLSNLYDDNRSVRGVPLSDAPDEEVSFVQTQFSEFVPQLLYPFIDSHWTTLVTLLAVTADNKRVVVEESQLMKLSHEAAMLLHRKQAVAYIQSSSKEALKNCITFLVEEGVLSAQMSPSVSYTLRLPKSQGGGLSVAQVEGMQKDSSPTAPGATSRIPLPGTLEEYLAFVNTLRWRPSSEEVTRESIAAISRLQLELLNTTAVQSQGKSKM